MLIGDTAYQQRKLVTSTVERTRALTKSALDHQRNEVDKHAPVDGFDPTKLEHQMGKPMWWKELCSRLERINPSIHFKNSPSAPDKTTALMYWSVEDGKPIERFLCAFEKTVLPEYTVKMPVYDRCWDAERRDIVKTLRTTKFVRGWREVVLMLLKSRLISEVEADEVFPINRVRKSWYEQLKAGPLRHTKKNRPDIVLAGG